MGFTDVFNSVTDKVKRNCPNVMQPVGNAWRNSYSLGRDTVLKVDNVVRVNASHKVNEYISNPETRQKIGGYAYKFLDSPLAKEGFKYIPGAYWVSLGHETYKYWSRSVQVDENTKSTIQGRIHKVKADAHLKYEKKVLQNVQARTTSGSSKAADPVAVTFLTPEEVLNDFIHNGFVGRDFMDSLFVPSVGTVEYYQQEDV